MIPKRITRRHLRLRKAIIEEIAKAVKRQGETLSVSHQFILPFRVVIDSPTEEHLRHVSGLVVGQKSEPEAIVFDNYDERTHTYPMSEFNTDILLSILEIL